MRTSKEVPSGADALVLLTVEELAVNDLCEPCHHLVRTLAFPVTKGTLGTVLPHRPAAAWDASDKAADVASAREVWDGIDRDLKKRVMALAMELTKDHGAYGLKGLLASLERVGKNRREVRHQAWPRLLALFRLLHKGSPHPALVVPTYGGDLFRPGDGASKSWFHNLPSLHGRSATPCGVERSRRASSPSSNALLAELASLCATRSGFETSSKYAVRQARPRGAQAEVPAKSSTAVDARRAHRTR